MNQRELFLRHVAQTSSEPMMGVDIDIVDAKGCTLTARDGKKYLDLISGISVSSVGHCHPKVVEAIEQQSKKFMHLMVYGEFNQQPQVKYATTLSKYLPAALNSVYFTTSGSEAVEGALKLAKRSTGRTGIVNFHNAYHGSTQGALSVMGSETFKNSFRPLIPGTHTINFNDVTALDAINNTTAAVILEITQGEAGIRKGSREFLTALRQKCNDSGALLIVDEIQTGFGRTGSLFAFSQYNIVPDILLIAKGMGGGMPIGAFIASPELMANLSSDPILGHINTFGGNAVCVASAQAALEVIIHENLPARAVQIERQLLRLKKLPRVQDVRVHGALAAIEFGNEETNMKIVKRCLEAGVISDWFLFCPTAMRVAPPLTITNEELERGLSLIADCIG